jgi:RNA polymerase sigma factor (sigma-70 family)
MKGVERLLALLEDFRRDRSAAAMEEIVRGTRPRLLAAARRIGSREDAEDSVQAAYHALLARPEAPAVAVLPWLLAAVVRIAYRRKALARRELAIADRLARPATPFEQASRAEVAALVRGEVARLPARYRDPVVLFHLECLSVTEVARLLDIPASTVTTQLHRARLLLRTRLSPALLHSVMVVPWLFWDSCKALAVPVGGIMKAKTAVVVAGVALATGAVGLGAGLAQREPEPARSEARGEALPREIEREAELVELRQRVAELEGVQGGPGGAGVVAGRGPEPASRLEAAARAVPSPWTAPHVYDPEKAKAAAARLGVTEDQLAVAHQAYVCLFGQADPKATKEALDALAALGDPRTVAVAALLRGVEGGPIGTDWLNRLLAAARAEGQEQHIVDVLKDPASPPWIKNAIVDNAEAVDSGVVRDYLVERLGLEEDKYMFASIAMTLGHMREPRAAKACAEALKRGGDWAPFEVYALVGLEGAGREALAPILAYVDGPSPTYLVDGIRALATIDPAQARVRAEALLAHPTRFFTEADTEKLRKVAGR